VAATLGIALLVLATAAQEDRPWYRRDFLTCLASPCDHVVSFSYRTRWFAPSVLSRGFALEGEQAVIVFCAKPDEQATDFVYLPLRHVTIKALRPHEVVRRQLVDDDTYIAIDFELGDRGSTTRACFSAIAPGRASA
jgi:hypothetical protein